MRRSLGGERCCTQLIFYARRETNQARTGRSRCPSTVPERRDGPTTDSQPPSKKGLMNRRILPAASPRRWGALGAVMTLATLALVGAGGAGGPRAAAPEDEYATVRPLVR